MSVARSCIADVPEEPYLELAGKRLEPRATLPAREKEPLTVRCIIVGASPPVRHVHWFLADYNVTHASQLLMEYVAEEDNYVTQSVLTFNATKDMHQQKLVCSAHHVAWRGATSSVGITLDVTCK